MTLLDIPSVETKNGNDANTVFSFDFVINKASDLVVTVTDALGVETVITEGTGTDKYSLSVASYPGNGSITYPETLGTALATGATITLERSVEVNQATDLINQGAYKPEQVEAAFDYSRMVDQQQQDGIDRSIKVSVTDTSGADFTLPAPTADTVIGIWNDTADEIITGPTASEIGNAQTYATAAAASASDAETSETNADASAVDAADSAAAAQAAAAGIKWKASSKAATTADITLSGAQTVDGIPLVAGDICLVKAQAAAEENGLYVVVAAGAWTRHTSMDAWDEVPSAASAVEEGTANGDKQFICTSDQGGTLGVTAITWAAMNTGITEIVEDTTPQLGGPLDPNAHYIGKEKGADIADSATPTIPTDGDYHVFNGTTTVTSFVIAANRSETLKCSGVRTFTASASIVTEDGLDITTTAGQVLMFQSTAANVVAITKAPAVVVTGLPAPDFTSAEQTLTLDTNLNVAHGLGAVPTLVTVIQRCKTAEHGFSIGDERSTSMDTFPGAGDRGTSIASDTVNVTLVQGSLFMTISQITFNDAVLTPANWKWIVRAWT